MARRLFWLALIVGAVLVPLVVVVRLLPTPQSGLQGTWIAGGMRLTFRGDLAIMEREGESPVRTYFRLYPQASPPHIILFEADSPP
jgi:hypothetical protein